MIDLLQFIKTFSDKNRKNNITERQPLAFQNEHSIIVKSQTKLFKFDGWKRL